MCTFVSAFMHFCLSTDTSVEELRETTEALQKAAVIRKNLTFPINQNTYICTRDNGMISQMPLAYLSNHY